MILIPCVAPCCSAAVWDVHEQVAVAAMECGCKELALKLVKNVHKRFPEGARGSRLTVRCAAVCCVSLR